MAKRETTVWVVNDYSWEPPESLAEFVGWANSLLRGVPPEHQDEVGVSVESDYDSSSIHFQAWYTRLETDEEEAQREARERQYEDEQLARELATLRYLQSKYGFQPNQK